MTVLGLGKLVAHPACWPLHIGFVPHELIGDFGDAWWLRGWIKLAAEVIQHGFTEFGSATARVGGADKVFFPAVQGVA